MRRCRPICILLSAVLLTAQTAAAHPQWGVAVDRQGRIYFSDIENVWKVDADGRVSNFRRGGGWHTHDINVDDADNLYGADNSYEPSTRKFRSGIWKMTPEGAFSWVVPMVETLPTGTGIWRDKQGNTYHVIASPGGPPTLVRRSVSGEVAVLGGNAGAARSYRQSVPYSGGMGIGKDGTVFFSYGPAVYKAAASGGIQNLTGTIAKTGGSEGTVLLGLAIDDDSNIFVADWGNRRLFKIAADRTQSTVLTSDGSWYPTGVAARGNVLYVLEESHSGDHKPLGTRLRKLAAGGTASIIAEVDSSGNIVNAAALQPAGDRKTAEDPPAEMESHSFAKRYLLLLLIPVVMTGFLIWRRNRKGAAHL